ncbi:MAG: hypothetical protein QX190_12735 [Methylococcales bacterium]|jgi:hypothetical protein
MNTTYLERIEQEVKQMPPEYLPALLNIIHTFRESVQLNTATQSFQQGWQEALNGETQAIETLWDDLET